MNDAWLILETSGRGGSIALGRGGAIVRTVSLDASRRHARDLTATVDALLKAQSLRPVELAGVMVSLGPGSYTGLRVGLISAKALAYATGCALIAVPTFAAIAEQAPAQCNKLWVIADALQGQIYLERFERDPATGMLSTAQALDVVPFDESIPWAAPETWFSGPGAALLGTNLPLKTYLVPEGDRHPRAESLFKVGSRLKPATREEMFALEPLYLRGSSAEEKAKSTHHAPRDGPKR
jgi:tRNA threonylcarbamoyladenosine biosynthesis protein TsaB